MSDAKPYPKAQQLARGAKRYRRKIASPKQWQAIIAAKIGPCRVCGEAASNGHFGGRITFHHVVPRELHGDDVVDNIVPLCGFCHNRVTLRVQYHCKRLLASLTVAEFDYMIGKLGKGAFERVYGITYGR